MNISSWHFFKNYFSLIKLGVTVILMQKVLMQSLKEVLVAKKYSIFYHASGTKKITIYFQFMA